MSIDWDKIVREEGDYLEWIYTAQNGVQYNCHIKRNSVLLSLCGFVIVERGNLLYGKDYSDLNFINVHGGLTYGLTKEEHTVYGFDCGHWGDGYFSLHSNNSSGVYRNMRYVQDECNKMAEQFSKYEISQMRKEKIDEFLER
jgi:hypothetical protein